MTAVIESEAVISAPTGEKKVIPKSSGENESTAADVDTVKSGVRSFFLVKIETADKIKSATVKTATISGEKFAYPNGVGSK